ALLRVCYEATRASMQESCTLHCPREGGAWLDLAEALERYADLARDSGELPERMVIRLKGILEETLPRIDLETELRDIALAFSIETYFKSAQRRSGLRTRRANTDQE